MFMTLFSKSEHTCFDMHTSCVSLKFALHTIVWCSCAWYCRKLEWFTINLKFYLPTIFILYSQFAKQTVPNSISVLSAIKVFYCQCSVLYSIS